MKYRPIRPAGADFSMILNSSIYPQISQIRADSRRFAPLRRSQKE